MLLLLTPLLQKALELNVSLFLSYLIEKNGH